MSEAELSRAVDTLTQRILKAAQALGGVKHVVIVPHSVAGHFICRVHLEPRTNRNAYRKLFNGTAVGDSVYFTEPAPQLA